MCEPCTTCEVKTICDACVPDGEWKHLSGVNPCQPVLDDSNSMDGSGKVQRDRFSLREGK